MAKIKEESLRLNIIINGDNARKQMAEYEKVLDDPSGAEKACRPDKRSPRKGCSRNRELHKAVKRAAGDQGAHVGTQKRRSFDLLSFIVSLLIGNSPC